MLPDNLFINLIDENLLECMVLKDPEIPGLTMKESREGKVWFRENRLFVPEPTRREILQLFHDHPLAGHPGQQETYLKIQKDYWWPGISKDVKNYVKGCGICQQFKIN